MDYKERLEIDIIDLLKSIMKKWKVMLIGAIIVAILAGVYGYIKSATVVNAETGEAITADEDSPAALREKLAEADAQVVENAITKYIGYTYQLEVEYAKLDFDPDNIYTYVLTYAIVDDSQDITTEEDNAVFLSTVNNIVAFYQSQLTNENVLTEIIDELSIDVEPEALKSMMSISKNGDSLLTVSVVSEGRTNTKKFMSILKNHLNDITSDIQKIYTFSLVPVTDYFNVSTSNYVTTLQQQNTDNRTNATNNIAALTNGMSEAQKSYYNALVLVVNEAKAEIGIENFEKEGLDTVEGLYAWYDANQDTVTTKVVRSIDKKFIILGFVGGFFIVMMCYALLYILSGKLHTSDDLRDAFELNYIGEATKENNNLITSGIELLANKNGMNKLCIIGATNDTDTSAYRQDLMKQLKSRGISNVLVGNNVLGSADDLNSLSVSEGVVLIREHCFLLRHLICHGF